MDRSAGKAAPDVPEAAQTKDLVVAMGRRIVQLRKRRRWSQGELAKRLGITRERVGNWERGDHAPPLEALAALGEVLRVPLDELVTGKKKGRWLSEEERKQVAGLLAELSELLG
jgi:transcriptional regulator with XRE-family HTH domain